MLSDPEKHPIKPRNSTIRAYLRLKPTGKLPDKNSGGIYNFTGEKNV